MGFRQWEQVCVWGGCRGHGPEERGAPREGGGFDL